MSITRVPMTVNGAEKLRNELDHLKTIDRPRIIQEIAQARAHGDLKENAEYHAAREAQSFTEGRIIEIEAKLAASHIIDVSKIPNTGKVIFGATVTLQKLPDQDKSDVCCYTIVGEDEADISSGKISVTSPVARAMIGKCVNDSIMVNTQDTTVEYSIIKVDYI